jgi:hypothetical protein
MANSVDDKPNAFAFDRRSGREDLRHEFAEGALVAFSRRRLDADRADCVVLNVLFQPRHAFSAAFRSQPLEILSIWHAMPRTSAEPLAESQRDE